METHNKPTRVTGAAEALRVVEGILWHYENKEKGGRIVIEITVTEDTGVIRCGFCNRVIERSGRRKYCKDLWVQMNEEEVSHDTRQA